MSLVKKVAQEYMRLIDEGWSPEIDEFLGRVPRDLREPCRVEIEGMLAAAGAGVQTAVAEEPEPEPVTDPDTETIEVTELAEPVAAGPQRMTKEEAMAMWDSQVSGA